MMIEEDNDYKNFTEFCGKLNELLAEYAGKFFH